MPSNLGMFIPQLLASVGLTWAGPQTSSEIRISLRDHIIDITLTASCVRNSDMGVTTEASQRPSQDKQSSQKQWSATFNPNTSPLFRHTLDGTLLWMCDSEQWDHLLRLLVESDGSSVAVTIQAPYGKRLLMTL